MRTITEPKKRSDVSIRDVAPDDLPSVFALNEQSVPAMNSLAPERLAWFADAAAYFRVAEISSAVAGFLVCFAPGTPYDSPNYRWVDERFSDFLYIDRVAVSPVFRRLGIARALYVDAAATAGKGYRRLACEVNIRPRNPESLELHERLGFKAVGTQDHGYVAVQYMVKRLPL